MCSIEAIVSYGKQNGYHAMGLVDRNVLSGAMPFKKACQQANIKPIYGLEFSLSFEGRIHDMILYARNDRGYRNLMGLSSLLCTQKQEYIDVDTLNQYREDNILCLLSDDMPLTAAIDKHSDIEEELAKQNEVFGHYIVGLMDHDIAINRQRDEHLKTILEEHKISYIALSRTFYPEADDVEAYQVLKCIRDKKLISDDESIPESGRYFLSKDQFSTLYDQKELDNTDILAENCTASLTFTTQLPEYKNKLDVPSKQYLVSLCKEGLKRRLKNDIPEAYQKRLDHELKIILDMHFEDYFLIVYDFILYAKKNDILVGPGRGSAAGSLVSYCLGITDIDPLKYGLIFERFLNPERISMPDIDTDFPDDKRDQIIAYARDRYGADHVAHIITFGTLKARQVLRDVGRVLNYSTREIDDICKLIPNMNDMDLHKAYQTIPLFKQKIESEEKYRHLYRLALKLEKNPRHESTHAAGVVFSRKNLTEVVPITSIESDIYSTQYTMEHLEELGLIKMDLLAIRNLTIISEIVDDIRKDKSFRIQDVPLDDEATFRLIDNVNTLGIFQLESAGMRNLIRKMKPRNFAEIGVAIALFRPGPMKNIPTFLENRAHPERIEYPHPSLTDILKETYGIIVYQEQIMDIARKMAGFTYSKADILRKAMAKKHAEELQDLYPDFINGCLKNGYSKQISEKIYALIQEFANYGFNKSHSIAYALVAYWLAYLKANYPLPFYKALLNGVIGSQSKTYDYINECTNIGNKVLGPSINLSSNKYMIKEDAIVMPLSACKDVGSVSVSKIIASRESEGLYKDYLDAVCRLSRASIDRNVIENLIYAGAFDEFKLGRNTMLKNLNNAIMYANAHKNETLLSQDFDDSPIITEYHDDKLVLAENEKAVLGFYFSFNPLLEVKKKYNIDTENLYDLANSYGDVKGFGLIQRVKVIRTKKGDMMAFVDLIDDKGQLSLAVMPRLYSQYADQLIKGKYVSFEGKIEKEASCLVKKMTVL